MKGVYYLLILMVIFGGLLTSCSSQPEPEQVQDGLVILAAESFLADIVQNVAGEQSRVETLVPAGSDPHSFQATPQDMARIEKADLFVINGGGLEEWLEPLMGDGFDTVIVVASEGLEPVIRKHEELEVHGHEEGDPHFWLDPNNVKQYVRNIQAALTSADPAGEAAYEANAAGYIKQLEELDLWIVEQTARIPKEARILVTNHESMGYFADRYGYTVAGAVIPSVSSGATSSAADLSALVDKIEEYGIKAIFIETGANPDLATQIARETGITVVDDIYTHSLTGPDGNAPTYIEMMKYNTSRIVDTLK
ncbi:MAG TPA: metal ABC transporter substrate-binding protein [Anaerolineaceae bacterium]|nr:metal ABC transporter substrate-binding protein [Anaerolineaceae bacterium]